MGDLNIQKCVCGLSGLLGSHLRGNWPRGSGGRSRVEARRWFFGKGLGNPVRRARAAGSRSEEARRRRLAGASGHLARARGARSLCGSDSYGRRRASAARGGSLPRGLAPPPRTPSGPTPRPGLGDTAPRGPARSPAPAAPPADGLGRRSRPAGPLGFVVPGAGPSSGDALAGPRPAAAGCGPRSPSPRKRILV